MEQKKTPQDPFVGELYERKKLNWDQDSIWSWFPDAQSKCCFYHYTCQKFHLEITYVFQITLFSLSSIATICQYNQIQHFFLIFWIWIYISELFMPIYSLM